MSRVLGNTSCDLDLKSRSNNVFSCKCIFPHTIGHSNLKVRRCIGHMMWMVLGYILCDLYLKVKVI